MKILVFHHVFFGLSETFIYRQVKGLQERFDIELVSYKYTNQNLFPLSPVSSHRISLYENILDKAISWPYRKVLNPDFRISLYTYTRLSKLIDERKVTAMHAHYGRNGLKILPVAKRGKIPLVVSFHGNDASKDLRNPDYVRRLPSLFDYASAIILCSSHMINSLNLHKWMDKVHVVPYGINPEEFAPGGQLEETGKIKILHSGRLAVKKGVPDLIRVFARLAEKHKNIELHILGDGPDRQECERLVQNAALGNRVFFYGAQPQAMVKRLLNDANIFVLNSRVADNGDMEGLPNSILEAMSMEKAIVSTLHAGIPEAIVHGKNGLLVPEKRNDALEAALDVLISDEEYRLRLGKASRQRILESFTLQIMNEKLAAIFRRF